MSRTPIRRADEHIRWLKNIASAESFRPEGPLPLSLGALTGTDFPALEAVDRLWQLYFRADQPQRVIMAIALTTSQMQPGLRYLARELVAHAGEWSHRDKLWPQVEAQMTLMGLQ